MKLLINDDIVNDNNCCIHFHPFPENDTLFIRNYDTLQERNRAADYMFRGETQRDVLPSAGTRNARPRVALGAPSTRTV